MVGTGIVWCVAVTFSPSLCLHAACCRGVRANQRPVCQGSDTCLIGSGEPLKASARRTEYTTTMYITISYYHIILLLD